MQFTKNPAVITLGEVSFMFSIKRVCTDSVKQIFSICFLVVVIFSFSIFGQSTNEQETNLLSTSQIIERELAGGQSRTYRITLKANEFLQVRVEQKGINVVVKLFDSNRRQLAGVNNWHGEEGFEELSFITEKAGEYDIQISAINVDAESGKYSVQWIIRQATENDRKLKQGTGSLVDLLFNKTQPRGESAVVLINQANNFYHLGQYQKAKDYYEGALILSRENNDKFIQFRTLTALSTFYERLGNNEKAKDYNERALKIRNKFNNKEKIYEAHQLVNEGQGYLSTGKFGKAINSFEQALINYRETNDRYNEAASLGRLGNLYRSLGQYEKARDNLEKALLVFKSFRKNLPFAQRNQWATLLHLGSLFSELKQFEKARDYCQQALDIVKQGTEINLVANALKRLGFAYKELGEYEKALDYIEQALAIDRETKELGAESYSLNLLGIIYKDLGQYEKAKGYFEQALVIDRNSKYKFKSLNNLADAKNFTYHNLFELYEKSQPHLAIFYGIQVVNVYQKIRSNINNLDKVLQESYLAKNVNVYRRLADILISEGRFPEAQVVLDLLKEEEFGQIARRGGESLITLPYNRTEEEAIKIIDKLAALGHELSELKAKPKDSLTATEINRLSEIESVEVPIANKALRQATEALSKVAPDVKNAIELKMKDNIQSILPALGKGVVALYTVIGKTTINENANNKLDNNKINIGWILLVTPEFRKAYPIDTTDLEQNVFKLRETLRSPKYDSQPVAQELYHKLFLQTSAKQKTTLAADLETYLGKSKDKTLMWSLDGVLRYIPMAALHDGKSYLVEKYRNVVFNTASLGSLKDSVKPNWEVAGFGVSTEGTVKAFDGRTLRFSALKGAESELNSIVKENNEKDGGIFPGTLKINNEFTKEALFQGARTGMPVIHISSHFWYNPAREETSFLLLGNGGRLEVIEFQDYPNLFSNVDFLSLSACDTATGGNANNNSNGATAEIGKAETEENTRQSNGKEIEGFAYVAQTLGAKSVMASLWQVSDEGTKELMLKFYQIKKEQLDLPKGEALRQAQLSLLQGSYKTQENRGETRLLDLVQIESAESLKPFKKDEKAPFAHPYYWSPFVLIGNWR